MDRKTPTACTHGVQSPRLTGCSPSSTRRLSQSCATKPARIPCCWIGARRSTRVVLQCAFRMAPSRTSCSRLRGRRRRKTWAQSAKPSFLLLCVRFLAIRVRFLAISFVAYYGCMVRVLGEKVVYLRMNQRHPQSRTHNAEQEHFFVFAKLVRNQRGNAERCTRRATHTHHTHHTAATFSHTVEVK